MNATHIGAIDDPHVDSSATRYSTRNQTSRATLTTDQTRPPIEGGTQLAPPTTWSAPSAADLMQDLAAREAAVDRGLRVVLAHLELVSSAPSQRLDTSCGSGGEPDAATVWVPHERVRWRLAGVEVGHRRRLDAAEATGDFDQRRAEELAADSWRLVAREGILRDARDELAALTGSNGESPVAHRAELDEPGALQQLIVEEGEGWPPEDVGRRFRLAPAFVRRLRVRAERDPDTGRPIDEGAATEAQKDMAARDERCRQLASEGKTQRQIAMLLRLHRTQVRRALGKAA